MRRYHFRVALLTLGVLLGFGSAIARFGFGYELGPGCHDWHHGHHGHHGYHHHHDCECGDEGEGAPAKPGGVSSNPT